MGGSIVQILFILTDFFFFLVCCLYQLLSGLLTSTAIMAQFLLSFCQSLFMYFGDHDQLMEVEFLSAML